MRNSAALAHVNPLQPPWTFRRLRLDHENSFVGRTGGAGEVLGPDLVDVESSDALTHGLEDFFENRRLAGDPTQRVDARNYERAQVGADQATFFQLFDNRRNF